MSFHAAGVPCGFFHEWREKDMPRKVIIDCDPGIDDSLAIMLALSVPEEIEVCGICVVAGNAPVSAGVKNALKVLRFMDRLDIPVFTGAEAPLRRDFVDALDTHGADGLGESNFPEVPETSFRKQTKTAAEFMADALRNEREDGISVIALGPLTNLAILAENDPEAFGSIRELVSMGGAFKSHGNCSPVAEYNYWCDPDAAAFVYREADRQGMLIRMVGLDVTRRIVLTPDLVAYMKHLDSRMGGFIEKITDFYMDFHYRQEHLIGCVINDPLAVAYFLRPDLCTGFSSYVQIETEGISIGQSVVDSMNFYRHSPNAVVLTKTDPTAFFRLFFEKLLHLEKNGADLLPELIHS